MGVVAQRIKAIERLQRKKDDSDSEGSSSAGNGAIDRRTKTALGGGARNVLSEGECCGQVAHPGALQRQSQRHRHDRWLARAASARRFQRRVRLRQRVGGGVGLSRREACT